MEIAEELHIHLQLVEPVILQHVQGGVAAAEVVHPDLIARALEAGDDAAHEGFVVAEGALRDLDADKVFWHPVLRHRRLHHGEHIAQLTVQPGEIDGYGDQDAPALRRLPVTGAHLPGDIGVQLMDAAAALQNADEAGGGQQTPAGVIPPGQSLQPAQLAGDRAHHRLGVDFDVLFFQRLIQMALDILFQRQRLRFCHVHPSVRPCGAGQSVSCAHSFLLIL